MKGGRNYNPTPRKVELTGATASTEEVEFEVDVGPDVPFYEWHVLIPEQAGLREIRGKSPHTAPLVNVPISPPTNAPTVEVRVRGILNGEPGTWFVQSVPVT